MTPMGSALPPPSSPAVIWGSVGQPGQRTHALRVFAPMQVEDEEYQLKPMNCPFHVGIYKEGYHSYRDLPIRMAELGTVYR